MAVRVTGISQAFGGASERLQRAALAAANEMAEAGAAFIKQAMRDEGKTDTDLTAQSIKAHPAQVVVPGLVRSEVAPATQQLVPALILDEGRKRGRPVSREGERRIGVWARRKAKAMVDRLAAEIRAARKGRKRKAGALPPREEAEKRAAFLIARAIKNRGMVGRHYFRRARHHVQNQAMAIYRRVLARLPRGAAR